MKISLYSFLCIILIHFSVYSQTDRLGKTVSFSTKNFNASKTNFVQSNGLVAKMAAKLPIPDGTLGDFVLNETLLGEKRNPTIQTYDGVSVDGTIILKLTVTAEKIEGLMHTPDGYFVIEPLDLKQDLYLVYNMNEIPSDRMKCGASGETLKPVNKSGRVLNTAPFPIGTQMRNYRLAAAATGEMTNFYTNQAGALAQITSVMNAANLIYELEASIHFTLTSATTGYSIIFTDANTDPFTVDPNFSNAGNSQTGFTAMNTSNLLPYTNYDVGHTFNTLPALNGSYSISGQAGPTPCQDASKSRGWTQWTLNAALGAIVNLFVHEVGHQFSAPHTFNAVGGPSSGSTFCTGGWSSTSAIEPGSGATLMGYANNCTNPNYTLSGNNNLNYFHTKSLEFIYNAVTGSSGTCITQTATGNTPPIANAGIDVIIPKGTPFKLTGTASDANQDMMSYTWEQYDVATTNDKGALGSSILGTGGYYAVNSTTAPLFRSQMSTTALDRNFPKLTHILNSANDPAVGEGENLPQVARTMKFRFTVRDNRGGGGGVDSDETIVTVDNSGPFLLTSQNSSTLWIYNGSNTAGLTWSVNGTNAAPLSVQNVKITFSTDGGATFPIILLASTPNDGTEPITIPNNLTSQGRIKIEPVGTYAFFDVNNVNVTISDACNAEITSITPNTAVSAQVGNAALNLGLSAYGNAITSFTGSLTSSDGSSTLVGNNGGTCINYGGNSTKYDIYSFKVITTASYTFTISGHPFYTLFNLYNGVFNASSPCTNWMASTYDNVSNSLSTTITKTLTPGTYYIMVSSFSASQPTLPANYTITPSGGTIYSNAPTSGSPYDYTYLAVNNAGNISGFSSTSNFTNASIYTADTYTVYGLSYQGGLSLSAYAGTSLSSFQALLSANTVCGKLSSNTKNVTITPCTPPTVAAISGASAVCVGSTIALTNATAGGVWSSSAATSIATISASGVVIGVGAGTTTINYSVTVNGCVGVSSTDITVNPVAPMPIAQANTQIASGESITLTASGCGGMAGSFALKWYKTSDNSVITMPVSPTTTTNYYAKCEQTLNGIICSSANSANVQVDVSVDVVSIISGNWESLTTWNIGRVPLSTDKVVINTAHNVTVTTNNAHASRVEYRGTGKIIFSTVNSKLYLGL